MIPAWFSETFIIDHQNAQSWRSQKDKLLSVDSLQLMVSALQDAIMQLEVGKSLILEAGYGNAFNAYQGLSDRYIAEMRRPRVSLGTTVGVLALSLLPGKRRQLALGPQHRLHVGYL